MIGRKEGIKPFHFCVVQNPLEACSVSYCQQGVTLARGLSRRELVCLFVSLCGHLAFSTLGKTVPHCHSHPTPGKRTCGTIIALKYFLLCYKLSDS